MKPYSFIILITQFLISSSDGFTCDRMPKKAENPKPNIDKYVIEVLDLGTPPKYSPGKVYKVALKTNPQNPITNTFTQFMVVAEPERPLDNFDNVLTGELKPVDYSIATFTPKCASAIIQTNNLAKSNVEIWWTAPPSGNGCIDIKATVYESSDSWYADDGGLTKNICEEEENKDVQPPFFKECCACNEAKYEVAFQGMWTRNTHPNDYPPFMWNTKLGEVIGASHKYSKSFWEYGSLASQGLQLLAEQGKTSELENELKELVKSDDIRTIIKARELPYPNITGTSYTVFRVDQEHHLISLVSKITPSPDWIVGVANLELCTANCTWIPSRTINLYPWDVGTDGGTSYDSLDEPLASAEEIKPITSDLEGYPFHSEEAIKPIAQLRVTRQKLYDKICEKEETTEGQDEVKDDEACNLTEWSEWSECSTTCGNEVRTRERQLVIPENIEVCSQDGPLELQETSRCFEISTDECEPTQCATAIWTEWSTCNATCGTGYKTRYGRFNDSTYEEDKETEEQGPCEETVQCPMPECQTENELSIDSQILISQGPSMRPVVGCKLSEWSEWSSCNATEPCTRGIQVKTRHIVIHASNGGKACPKKLLRQKKCKIPCNGVKITRKPWSVAESSSEAVDCQLGPWTDWTPCSSNCGSTAVQIRSRTIEVPPSNGGKPCGPRIQNRKCSLPYACDDRQWRSLTKY